MAPICFSSKSALPGFVLFKRDESLQKKVSRKQPDKTALWYSSDDYIYNVII
jgi:hypothetical protein